MKHDGTPTGQALNDGTLVRVRASGATPARTGTRGELVSFGIADQRTTLPVHLDQGTLDREETPPTRVLVS